MAEKSALQLKHEEEARERAAFLAKPQSFPEVRLAVHGLLDATFNGYVGPEGPRGPSGATGPAGPRGPKGTDGLTEDGVREFVYPVGSAVLTGTPTNPGGSLGGVWIQIGTIVVT